jgi:hypothetical protein
MGGIQALAHELQHALDDTLGLARSEEAAISRQNSATSALYSWSPFRYFNAWLGTNPFRPLNDY